MGIARSETQTTRLLLRRLDPSYLDELCVFYSDPEVMKYIGDGKPRSRAETQAWIAKRMRTWQERGFGPYLFVDKATGKLVGRGGLGDWDETGRVELGFGLLRSQWGKGLATEAALAIKKIGFEDVGLEEIYGTADPANLASQNVLQKIGMTRLGVRPYTNKPAVFFIARRERQPAAKSE